MKFTAANYLRVLGLITLAFASAGATAGPPVFSYDNFRSGHIDPSKWTSVPYRQCNQQTTLECVRKVTPLKFLELGVRTLGTRDSDSGRTFDSSLVQFTNPSSINGVSADVWIAPVSSVQCANNTGERSHSQFILSGSYFNTGASPDFTGDMDAYVFIDNNNPDGHLFAAAFLGVNNQYFGNVFLGDVSANEPLRLSMRWDPSGSQFVFSLTHILTGQQSLASIPYSQPVASAPAQPFKEIGARTFVQDCVATQTSTQMDAFVSNVQVNSPLVP